MNFRPVKLTSWTKLHGTFNRLMIKKYDMFKWRYLHSPDNQRAQTRRMEHSHTRSCILVLYFWEISANEHQKQKNIRNEIIFHIFTWKKWNIFNIYIYIYLCICCYKHFLGCTMQTYDCTSIPDFIPELLNRALLTSNRKKMTKNIQCTFIIPHSLINSLHSQWLFIL